MTELGDDQTPPGVDQGSATRLVDYLGTDRFRQTVENILPTHMDTPRFVSVCLRQLGQVPALQNCTLASVIGGMMSAATLGLEIGTQGECWLLPFWNNHPKGGGPRVQEAQLQIGVWGHMALAWRSQQIRDVQIDVVLSGDNWSFRKGSEPYLHHEPRLGRNLDDVDAIEWVYAVVRTTLGGVIFNAYDSEWIERIRGRSMSPDSPAWQNFFAEQSMAKALKSVLKVCPKSREMARAITLDDEADANVAQVWDVDTSLLLPASVSMDPATEAAREGMREMGKAPAREPEPVPARGAERAGPQSTAGPERAGADGQAEPQGDPNALGWS